MDRLTKQGELGPYWNRAVFAEKNGYLGLDEDMILDRLAAYEDTGLTPEQIKYMVESAEARLLLWFETRYGYSAGDLMGLLEAKQEGRLVVLPCKVGDTVYQLRHKQHAKGVGISPRIVSSACVWSDGSYALCHQGMTYCQSKDLGKTWFLSREEAEKALRGEE